MDEKPNPTLSTGKGGSRISLAELQAILHDDGYSGDARLNHLKKVLSDLTQENSTDPDAVEMREAVKQLIERQQDGEPIAKDVL